MQKRINPDQKLIVAILALLIGILSLIRDFTFLRIYGIWSRQDTVLYESFSSPLRTFPYPFLNELLQTVHHPAAIIVLQIVISAGAAATITFVLARINFSFGFFTGILSLLNFATSLDNLELMTESIFTSFHLLSLACLVVQYQRRSKLTRIDLLLAGLLYGWTMLIRPANLMFLPLLFVFYLTIVRRRIFWLVMGSSSLYLVAGLVYLNLFGQFSLMQRGEFAIAFPLYTYKLFKPENGPVSQKMYDIYITCNPQLDFNSIGVLQAEGYVYFDFIECFKKHNGNSNTFATNHVAMYLEAVSHDPVHYATTIYQQWAIATSFPVALEPIQHFDQYCYAQVWCQFLTDWSNKHQGAQTSLSHLQLGLNLLTWPLKQPYLVPPTLLSGSVIPRGIDYSWSWYAMVALICFLAWVSILFIASRGVTRLIVAACFVMVSYTLLFSATITTFADRYSEPLLPFLVTLSALTICLVTRRSLTSS